MTQTPSDEIKQVTLEWSYTPTDFFEVEDTVESDGYVLVIGDGKAHATIQPDAYNRDPEIIDQVHQNLVSRFRAIQLVDLRPFELSSSPRVRLQTQSGAQIINARAIASSGLVMTGRLDVILRDVDGKIIADTKQERITRKRHLATLTSKHAPTDPTLEAILKSMEKSFTDTNNLLVHLYEIRDALKKRFGDREDRARTSLGISKNRWNELGRLANDAPLKQGRHRGSKIGSLRDATDGEIATARSIASEMIEKYVEWLEMQT